MEDLNHNGIPDSHEAKMAKADLYKLANYSMKLYKMIHEGDPMEGWVTAKITKAADYIASVYHFVEYELKTSEYGNHLESAEMYSESVRRALQQKLTEAKKQKEKIAEKNKKDLEKDEEADDKKSSKPKKGVNPFAKKDESKDKDDKKEEKVDEAVKADEPAPVDKSAAQKRKELQARKDKLEDEKAAKGDAPAAKKSATRKVSGKAYGGSAQVDEAKAADTLPDVDKSAAQKRKDRQARMDKLEDEKAAKGDAPSAKTSAVRKVAGKAYGGSKQAEVDEGFGYDKFGKKTDAYYAAGGGKSRRDVDKDDEGWSKTKKADDKWNKEVAAKGPVKESITESTDLSHLLILAGRK